MTILFEKWPRRIEIRPVLRSWPVYRPKSSEEIIYDHVNFFNRDDAEEFLRDLAFSEPDFIIQLRNFSIREDLNYHQLDNEEVIRQFAELLATKRYSVIETYFVRMAWEPKPPPAPLPPFPHIPHKPSDPPIPSNSKSKLVEFVEVIYSDKNGVVVGPGPASKTLPTLRKRQDQKADLYKQFINLDKFLETDNKPYPEYGEYIEMQAKVELDGQPKSGESVEFRFTVQRGVGYPAALSRHDQGGFVHRGGAFTHIAQTGADGWTEKVSFFLSVYAGDYFTFFAKGPDGKELKIGPYQVWRRFWYQITHAKKDLIPRPTQAEAVYEQVFAEMVPCESVEIDETKIPTAGTLYPAWMVQWPPGSGGNEKISVIGTHNSHYFSSFLKEEIEKPLKAHLLIHGQLWDAVENPSVEVISLSTNPELITLDLDGSHRSGVLNPPLNGGPLNGGRLLIQGTWREKNTGKEGVLTDKNILIEKEGRANFKQVKIVLPPEAPDPMVSLVVVTLQIQYASHAAGQKSNKNQMHISYPQKNFQLNQVIVHEIGHAFNQTPEFGRQPSPLPYHPNQYIPDGGDGSHCNTGAIKKLATDPKINPHKEKIWDYEEGTCVMFGKVSYKNTGMFCTVCQPYVRLERMKQF